MIHRQRFLTLQLVPILFIASVQGQLGAEDGGCAEPACIIPAKNELTKTDDAIAAISEKCGFSSLSYFCRAFRHKEGCTPLQYRKQHR